LTNQIIRKFHLSKILIPLLVIILVLGFFAQVSAAAGNIIYVNGSGGNDANDGSSWAKAKKTILNATGNVNNNGMVNIANGQYSGTGNTQIIINQSMTINGQSQGDTVINGTGANWIFQIPNNINLILNNLTFTNATRNMGGVITNNGVLTVNNCTFTSNNATTMSGAIANYGTITVTDTNFEGNNASDGGAIANYGISTLNYCNFLINSAINFAGAFYNLGISTINYCNFNDNSAHDGGAIYNSGNTASLGVNFCSFTNNAASWNGGAIYNSGGLGVSNCTFNGNSAMGGGGADIYNALDSSITSSSFTSNTISALYNDHGKLTAHYCKILGDVFAMGGTTDMENNWWGTNFKGTDPVSTGRVVGATVYHWIVLSLTAYPSTINHGGTSTIIADLLHDQKGNYLDPSLGHIPDNILVAFQTDNGSIGSIGSKIINKLTKNGIALAIFIANDAANQAKVSVTIDGQTLTTNINIKSQPTTNITAKTVPMQTTGLPLTGILIAALIVMGGLIYRKN
jgi:hypothetical protein